MKPTTIPGKYYIVRSKTGCTVTQETAPGKYITASIPADEDTPVFAHAGKFDIDDEGAIVTEVFNSAPQQRLTLLGVLGGKLPAGYTRLAYLESSGTQYIVTGVVPRQGPLYRVTCDAHYLGPKNRYAPFMSVIGDAVEGHIHSPRLSLGYTDALSSQQTRVLAANVGWNRSRLSVNPNTRHRYKVAIRRDENFPELYFDGERLAVEDVTPGLYIGVIQYPLFLFANNLRFTELYVYRFVVSAGVGTPLD
jgi:hypothetical protein